MGTFIMIYVFVLLIVGITQSIGSFIRGNKVENWKSDYGRGLSRYYTLYTWYWTIAITFYILIMVLEVKDYGVFAWMVPAYLFILPLGLAIYYWQVVYYADKIFNT